MSQLRFRTVAADPERALNELQARETETAQMLADIRQQIKLVKRVLDAQRGWAETFGSDPDPDDDRPHTAQPPSTARGTNGSQAPESDHDRGSEETIRDQVPSVNVVGITPAPRRVQVLRLLGQDPSSWWKVRDVAEALEIDNQKSLRVLLGQLAQKGQLIKTSDAWFRYNDGSSVPEPRTATPSTTNQGAAM
ncbi:hypothetical protein E1287_21195 [Actinomadura sp. KC06]|uniref:hypothetical protein n=1 Tax=Actinomadura sp. KC06 TaxID=2530369 RepID=UPI00104F09BB|nr:hypothetical protein [Actinomadura sp. KC06]TDD32920.1 hypothetical protein E1287_21195 [Actinomadura sp. KC06]